MFRLLNILLASVSALSTGEYQAPGPNDARGPCPGFNVMANHGYLPRDGGLMTREQVVQAFQDNYSVDPSLTNTILDTAIKIKLINNETQTFTLTDLRRHNFIEHDASLFRNDAYFGDNFNKNLTLLEQLISSSSDGKSISVDELAKYRKARQDYSKATNPEFTFGRNQEFAAFQEASILAWVIGDEDTHSIPINVLRTFIADERLPTEDGWTKKSSPIDNPKLNDLAAVILSKAAASAKPKCAAKKQ